MEGLRELGETFSYGIQRLGPCYRRSARPVSRERARGENQDHVTIEGAGHFLQEQAPVALSEAVIEFIKNNPLPR